MVVRVFLNGVRWTRVASKISAIEANLLRIQRTPVMKLAKFSFMVLQYLGFWRPLTWLGWKSWLYNIYTAFVILTLYSVTLSQLIELLRSIEDVEEFIKNSLILLTTTNACAKVANILQKRSEIIKLINILQSDPCRPRDYDEDVIQERFDYIISRNSLFYIVLTEVSVFFVTLGTVLSDTPHRRLAFNAWLPYSTDTEVSYWLTYVHQIVANTIGSFINISYDTLIPGCMMQTCAQFEILKHRFQALTQVRCKDKNISNRFKVETIELAETKIIAKCVQHHLEILRFAKLSNDTFTYTIFFQYSVSLVIICASVYGLSNAVPFTPEFTSIIVYLVCMLVQIFIFCFYGDKLTNKSILFRNDIYQMDWLELNIAAKKSLLTIMTRSQQPIRFTSGHMVVLSLSSFNGLLKLSYSAYNVLKQSS